MIFWRLVKKNSLKLIHNQCKTANNSYQSVRYTITCQTFPLVS